MTKSNNKTNPVSLNDAFSEFIEKARKYFGGIEMTWARVLILAVVTAVYTALINQIPFLKDTSFQDIAVYLECWILFAVFIIVNCKQWWEASLKCFVFFLVSQPLIYLIEVLFPGNDWSLFQYYRHWFIVTLLTLPGAAIAFLVKKKNWLSVLVLSVATGFLAYSSAQYFSSTSTGFPRHLLSAIFCIALAMFFIFVLLDDKKHRIAALAFFAALFIAFSAMAFSGRSNTVNLGGDGWSYSVEDDSIVNVKLIDGGKAKITAKKNGDTYISFKNPNGEEESYQAIVSGGGVWLTRMD